MRVQVEQGSPGYERSLLVARVASEAFEFMSETAASNSLTALEVARILSTILDSQMSAIMNDRYAQINATATATADAAARLGSSVGSSVDGDEEYGDEEADATA